MAFLAPLAPYAAPILWSAGSSIVTGITAYFALRHTDEKEQKTDTRGEINNNVHLAVKENNNQNSVVLLLLTAILIIKIFELITYTISRMKKNLKKGYERRYEQRGIQPDAVQIQA